MLNKELNTKYEICNQILFYVILATLIYYIIYTFRGLDKQQSVLLTHGDSIDNVAKGFKVIAQSGDIVAGRFKQPFGHDRMVVGFKTTYAISAHHHECEIKSCSEMCT